MLAATIALRGKVVVTMIDNNNWDYGLVSLNLFRLICIQNGHRPLNVIAGKEFDVYCLLNRLPTHDFPQYNITARKIEPIGSLRLGEFLLNLQLGKIHLKKFRKRDRPLIVFISQYRPFTLLNSVSMTQSLENGHKIICQQLHKMAKSGSIDILVACSCPPLDGSKIREAWYTQEQKYFKDILGENYKYSWRGDDNWASYHAMYGADVVIGIVSTMLSEAMQLGKPSYFCFPLCGKEIDELYWKGFESGSIELIQNESEFSKLKITVNQLNSNLKNNTSVYSQTYPYFDDDLNPVHKLKNIIREMCLTDGI